MNSNNDPAYEHTHSSKEVEELKEMFSNLIATRRFEINDFLHKPDSFATMDLAQASTIFEQSRNFKAAGICYNNIANIQYKNEKYIKAAENFHEALLYCLKHMDTLDESSPDRLEFEKIYAHRFYQRALSFYKDARYNEEKSAQKWEDVDVLLQQAITHYHHAQSRTKRFSFYDYIIKIIICRAFVNVKSKKLLTAEKILESAKTLIEKMEEGKIVVGSRGREEAPIIPLDILKQKYLLHRGFLSIALNKDQDACRLFTMCLRTGQIYDPRIRKECVIQLREIFKKYG